MAARKFPRPTASAGSPISTGSSAYRASGRATISSAMTESPIAAAVAAANAAGGGTVVLDSKPYWDHTQNLTIPATVRLTCGSGFVKSTAQWGVSYVSYPCSLYLASGKTFTVQGQTDGIGVFSDWVHFAPQPTNASTRAAITSLRRRIFRNRRRHHRLKRAPLERRHRRVQPLPECVQRLANPDLRRPRRLHERDGREPILRCQQPYPGRVLAVSHDQSDAQLRRLEYLCSCQQRLRSLARHDNTTNDLSTGEQVWVASNGTGGAGAGGLWTVTVIDTTHFDLQGSAVAPTTTGNPTNGLTYIPVASTANLQVGETVSGTGILSGATIAAVWQTALQSRSIKATPQRRRTRGHAHFRQHRL